MAEPAPTAPAEALVHVRCDLCGADDAEHRHRLVRASILTCRHCGFSYVSPRSSPAVLQARLQEWAEQDVVDAQRLEIAFEPQTLAYFRGLLRQLERALGRRGRLLDVGCATGALLTVARDLGWEVEGLEAGRASVAHARGLGLEVHEGTIEDHVHRGAPFDAIVCLEVIEHLTSPALALERFSTWLQPDGMLLLSTPNFDSLYRRIHGAQWWVINCEDEHIAFFSPTTLAAVLDRCGFDVVRMRVRSIDLPGILRRLRRPEAPLQEHHGTPSTPTTDGYYEARESKQRLKRMLARLGLLRAVRGLLALSDVAFSLRASPFYAMGDQLVCLARRRPG